MSARMSMQTLDEAALDHALKEAKRLGAGDAEAAIAASESLSVDVRMGALEGVEREESRALSVRLLFGQRQAGASTSNLSPPAITEMLERLAAAARNAPEDPFVGLADSELLARDFPDLELHDPQLITPQELERLALAAEAAALEVDGVTNSGGSGASWGASHSIFRTSQGFEGRSSGSSFGLGLAVMAEQKGEKERDYDGCSVRWLRNLPRPEEIGRNAGQRAAARLGSQKIDSCTAPVIFENRVAGRLFGALLGAAAGPAIARGVSFLKDRLGQQILPAHIDILLDPLRVGGHASRCFDGEGVAVRQRKLVDGGILTGWLLNSASARQLGLRTSGDASFGGGGPPGVTATNITISPGPDDLDALMRAAGKGLLITELFSPSLNPNSGDYSVGIAGFWLEGGMRAFPVSEITIAGNLKDFFARLVAGADLDRRSALETPSILIDGVTIAGR